MHYRTQVTWDFLFHYREVCEFYVNVRVFKYQSYQNYTFHLVFFVNFLLKSFIVYNTVWICIPWLLWYEQLPYMNIQCARSFQVQHIIVLTILGNYEHSSPLLVSAKQPSPLGMFHEWRNSNNSHLCHSISNI